MLTTLDTIANIVTPILSMLTVYLLSKKGKVMRWGYISGLASQPFWLFTTAYHNQWGLFCAAIFFTIRWGIGINNYWIKENA